MLEGLTLHSKRRKVTIDTETSPPADSSHNSQRRGSRLTTSKPTFARTRKQKNKHHNKNLTTMLNSEVTLRSYGEAKRLDDDESNDGNDTSSSFGGKDFPDSDIIVQRATRGRTRAQMKAQTEARLVASTTDPTARDSNFDEIPSKHAREDREGDHAITKTNNGGVRKKPAACGPRSLSHRHAADPDAAAPVNSTSAPQPSLLLNKNAKRDISASKGTYVCPIVLSDSEPAPVIQLSTLRENSLSLDVLPGDDGAGSLFQNSLSQHFSAPVKNPSMVMEPTISMLKKVERNVLGGTFELSDVV
jgi:hypothetical protein